MPAPSIVAALAALAPRILFVDLYPAGDGRLDFDRTISRPDEMESEDCLNRSHGSD